MERQIILDTETTGLSAAQGHRLIEVGCLEMVNRRFTGQRFHSYLNPERAVDAGAFQVHGISNEFLKDKPRFSEIAGELLAFISGAEVIIHNAPFDLSFLNEELRRLGKDHAPIETVCVVLDSLVLARQKHPGQPNSLDALCRRYQINNTHRDVHGALIDAQLLGQVYLAMTGGQDQLFANHEEISPTELPVENEVLIQKKNRTRSLMIIQPDAEEEKAHREFMAKLKRVD